MGGTLTLIPDPPPNPPRPRGDQPSWLQGGLLAASYVLAAWIGQWMAPGEFHVLPVGFPAGIALGGFLLLGRRVWPGIWIGALVTALLTPSPGWTAPVFATGITLGPFAGAWLIRRLLHGQPSFLRTGAIYVFSLGAALAATVSATLGTLGLPGVAMPPVSPGTLWQTWWIGDMLGAVLVAPLMLSARGLAEIPKRPSVLAEALGLTMLLVTSLILVFGWHGHHYPLTFLPVPFILWAALRFGLPGAGLASMLLACFGLRGTSLGFGPFASSNTPETILILQLFLGVIALSALVFAVESTQRKRMEGFFLEFVEGTDDLLTRVDLQGRFTYVNPASYRIFGLSPEECLGRSHLDFVHPDDRDRTRATFVAWTQGRMPGTWLENRQVSITGEVHDVMWTVNQSVDSSGALVAFTSIGRDLTRRKQAEEALRASEDKLRAIIEHAPDVVFIKDPDGRYLLGNPALARFVGKPLDTILGQTDNALFSPEHSRQFRNDDLRVLESGRLYVIEELVKDAGGSPRSFLTLKYPYLSPDGRIIGLIGIARDITDQKQTAEKVAKRTAERDQARELAHLKDHFLSMISHEMKTPLSLITGYAELLEDRCPGGEEIAGILDGSRRLTEHLNKLLDYSALLSGSLPLYQAEVNLREILSNVRTTIAEDREFQLKHLQFESTIDDRTPPLFADSRRVTQMILELLENARKFTPEGGRVGIRIGPEGEAVRIEVWDTGYGIPPQSLDRIWEAFTQLETQQAMRKGGLGLGLTIVSKLVELHGGRIEVASEKGKGSRFSLILPAEQASSAPPEPPGNASSC